MEQREITQRDQVAIAIMVIGIAIFLASPFIPERLTDKWTGFAFFVVGIGATAFGTDISKGALSGFLKHASTTIAEVNRTSTTVATDQGITTGSDTQEIREYRTDTGLLPPSASPSNLELNQPPQAPDDYRGEL
jgi:hypothetical protein